MYKLIIALLLFVSYSCSSNKTSLEDNIERIPVETEKSTADVYSFLEKIEIIPLETNDSSLTSMGKKVIYDKATDIYAIYTASQVVYTFKGDGKYIGNSRKMQGQGPQEYGMVLDMQFNPYLKGIDLLAPSGIIYTYDYPFSKLIAKRRMPSESFYNHFYPLDSVNYVFTMPNLWTDGEIAFGNLNTKQAVFAPYKGTMSQGNADECFFTIEDTTYFVPMGLNYYIYRIDEKKKELVPAMYLDFKDASVDEEDLPGCATGKRVCSNAERSRLSKGMKERTRYLMESEIIVPQVKLFNEDYVYIAFMNHKAKVFVNYVYNRHTKEYFLSPETGKPFYMQTCFGINDNVLLAISYPYYAPMSVDRNLMSEEEKEKMEQVKEDDNPVIIKYYLKK